MWGTGDTIGENLPHHRTQPLKLRHQTKTPLCKRCKQMPSLKVCDCLSMASRSSSIRSDCLSMASPSISSRIGLAPLLDVGARGALSGRTIPIRERNHESVDVKRNRRYASVARTGPYCCVVVPFSDWCSPTPASQFQGSLGPRALEESQSDNNHT